jgi:PTH1 family peptidyl-tRNA hydrolase
MRVVAGLGNPGDDYRGTRHNIGFEVVDLLAARGGTQLRRDRMLDALAGRVVIAGEEVLLVEPQSFMNLSGNAVRRAMERAGGTVADLLVVCDDYHLPVGVLRLRAGGSSGGHNGLADVSRCLGTQEVPRLRLGIGAPGVSEAKEFVLARFRPGERRPVEEAVVRAAEAVESWVAAGLERTMARYNGGPKDAPGRSDA